MNFQEAEAVIKNTIQGLDQLEYDGIIVKRLAKSNTLGKREGTNQSHIALTGDQMDIFPYVKLDGYFSSDRSDINDKKDLKTYFVPQVPFVLWKDNLSNLIEEIPEEFSFDVDETEAVYVSVVRSRREGSEQMQLSLLAHDDKQFVLFRRMLKEGDYLIILKRKEQLKYDCFGLRGDSELVKQHNLDALNNQFYNLKTQTEIHLDEVIPFQNECNDSEDVTLLKKQYNRIIFGAPGTGKSYQLNSDKDVLLQDRKDEDYERVTFRPDYSYANFVGTYKPVSHKMKDDNRENDDKKDDDRYSISYEYVPGPFMRAYLKAVQYSKSATPKPVLLIIEEINRANAAAVFGDIFQLLDRNSFGVSEYPIQTSEDVKKYLAGKLECEEEECSKMFLPSNLYIWATMNSADQGVYPMDTAFKRRWNFTYLGIDDNDEKIRNKYVYLADDGTQKIEWNALRKAINNFLAKKKINEDKQLGPYFISADIVIPINGNEIDRDKFIQVFKNKVIMYLFEDAARRCRDDLFEGCFGNKNRYSEICREFEQKGIGIFYHEIQLELDKD